MVTYSINHKTVTMIWTNQTGGAIAAGDVVVVDTAHDDSFVTTTTAGHRGIVGIAQHDIAAGNDGRIIVAGRAGKVNVAASVTRGHFGATSTTAKKAADIGADLGPGAFCQFVTGGTDPRAVVFGFALPDGGVTSDAEDVSIADVGGYFTSTDVEGALQELGAGAGTGLVGQPVALTPPRANTIVDASTVGTAQVAFAAPIIVPNAMKVRGLSVQLSVGGSGAIQWGLFDYSSSVSAATKLVGGSAAPGGTGWRSIAADSAPVTVAPGCYMLVVLNPSSNASTFRVLHDVNSVAIPYVQQQTSYVWDDTPDFASASWTATSNSWCLFLEGDLDGSGTRWT